MEVWLNNQIYKVEESQTIYQFCASKGINLPCFCYHEKLSIAGNCRICLVEVNTAANLVVSCAMPLIDKMRVSTHSERVQRAREGVIEFLLINHPLDCPICDQGGECDLQDLSLNIGTDKGRFYERTKRSVDNLNCSGPFIKTVMTRCIHCTRCVRFVNELTSNNNFGVIGRGKHMEIGTYIDQFIDDELLGNIIDLCPVGALTSMPYAFTTRAWENIRIDSIDILDSLCSSIRYDVVNNKITRVVPILDEFINEEWITNKTRFSYDSLSVQRLFFPLYKFKSRFIICSWDFMFSVYMLVFKTYLKKNVKIITGPYLDLQEANLVKFFANRIGGVDIFDSENAIHLLDYRYNFLLNNELVDLENKHLMFFLGINPRIESPLLNLRIRKSYTKFINFVGLGLGLAKTYFTFPITNMGNTSGRYVDFLNGAVFEWKRSFKNLIYSGYSLDKKILLNTSFITGNSFLNRFDSSSLLTSIFHWTLDKCFLVSKINVLNFSLGKLSFLELGLNNKINSFLNYFATKFFIHTVGLDLDKHFIDFVEDSAFLIYQGTFHHSKVQETANIVFPVNAHTEEKNIYLNIEGRLKISTIVIAGLKSVFKSKNIWRALFLSWKVKTPSNVSVLLNFYITLFLLSVLLLYPIRALLFKFLRFWSKRLLNDSFNFFFTGLVSKVKIINTIFIRGIVNYYAYDLMSKLSKNMNIAALKNFADSFESKKAMLTEILYIL